jgi:diguanylate cyclase (GGDEF)-like protein
VNTAGPPPAPLDSTLLAVLEGLPDGVVVLSESGRTLFANQAAASWLGQPASQIVSNPLNVPIRPGDEEGRVAELRVTTVSWDGTPAFVLQLHDNTHQYEAVRQLAHRATHDALTNLPNRYLLDDRLHQLLARSQRSFESIAVFYCDLDVFKEINDRYGHSVGDAVLVATARRLQEVVRPSDTVARISGDEFVILCERMDDTRARILADRVSTACEDSLVVDGVELSAKVSVGYIITDDPLVDPSRLLILADRAMYQQKNRRRSTRLPLFRDD